MAKPNKTFIKVVFDKESEHLNKEEIRKKGGLPISPETSLASFLYYLASENNKKGMAVITAIDQLLLSTGCFDKNKERIFEGDFVKVKHNKRFYRFLVVRKKTDEGFRFFLEYQPAVLGERPKTLETPLIKDTEHDGNIHGEVFDSSEESEK